MGLVDSVNPELAAVESLIQKHGGVRVWSGSSKSRVSALSLDHGWPRVRITDSADQLYRALGYDTLQELGSKLGKTPGEVAAKLSVLLPQAVDRLTSRGSDNGGRFPWSGMKKA